MTQRVNDGGPAFPVSELLEVTRTSDYEKESKRAGNPGMSLRDYFAAKIVAAIIAAHPEGYLLEMRDEDFAADPEGDWYRNKQGAWVCDLASYRRKQEGRFRLVTSGEYRMAREAYLQSDAMLSARGKFHGTTPAPQSPSSEQLAQGLSLHEFLEEQKLTLRVEPDDSAGVRVDIALCELKEGSMLASFYGLGKSSVAAQEDLVRKIRGRVLVFDAMGEHRRLIQVPKRLEAMR